MAQFTVIINSSFKASAVGPLLPLPQLSQPINLLLFLRLSVCDTPPGGSQKAQYSPYRHPPKLFHQPFKVQRLLQAMAISSTSPLSQCHHDEAQQCRASVTRPLISVCYTSPLLMTQSQNRSVVTTMTPITVN